MKKYKEESFGVKKDSPKLRQCERCDKLFPSNRMVYMNNELICERCLDELANMPPHEHDNMK